MGKTNFESLDHIFIYHTAFLGDLVLVSSLIQKCRILWPQAKIHLITTSLGREVYDGSDKPDSIFVYDKRKSPLYKSVRSFKKTYSTQILGITNAAASRSVILLVHESFRSRIFARLTGLRMVEYEHDFYIPKIFFALWDFCTFRVPVEKVPRFMTWHETSRMLMLLRPFLQRTDEDLSGVSLRGKLHKHRPFLYRPSQESQHPPQSLGEKLSFDIGLAIGANWGTKVWPWESYAALIIKIMDYWPQARCILVGGGAERISGEKVERVVISKIPNENQRFRNLCGATTIKDLKTTVAGLDLLIGNDTAVIHFASAYNVSTTIIYGATTPGLGFFPLADGSSVVEMRDLPCRPCGDHGPPACPLGHFSCMRNLRVEDVWQVVKNQLSSKGL